MDINYSNISKIETESQKYSSKVDSIQTTPHKGSMSNSTLERIPKEDGFQKTNEEKSGLTGTQKGLIGGSIALASGIALSCISKGRNIAGIKNAEQILNNGLAKTIQSESILYQTVDDLACQIKDVNLDKILRGTRGLQVSEKGVVLDTPELKPLENTLNKMLEIFPEFKSIIGKKQHETHKYSLDGHILSALQNSIQDQEISKLSQSSKRVLTIATFLHDIAKTEWVVDKLHPIISAAQVQEIVKRLNITDVEKDRIYKIVKNHHWVEELAVGKVTTGGRVDVQPSDIVKDFVDSEDFDILKILARADLKAVGNSDLYEACRDSWIVQAKRIQKLPGIHNLTE